MVLPESARTAILFRLQMRARRHPMLCVGRRAPDLLKHMAAAEISLDD
jgi:hypothetical protein